METKEALRALRREQGLSQDEMAEKLMVTRQAVSRWENGETVPGSETLKIIAKTFGVSINTLLGQPQNTVCQVCGSPLDAHCYSHEQDGSLNLHYCKWCYVDGVHQYHDMEQVIQAVVPRWNWGTPEQMSDWLRKQLVQLDYWKGRLLPETNEW